MIYFIKYDSRSKNVNRWVGRQSWENLPEIRTKDKNMKYKKGKIKSEKQFKEPNIWIKKGVLEIENNEISSKIFQKKISQRFQSETSQTQLHTGREGGPQQSPRNSWTLGERKDPKSIQRGKWSHEQEKEASGTWLLNSNTRSKKTLEASMSLK